MELSLGSAQFGGAYGIANQVGMVDKEQVKNILSAAREVGIKSIDTAIVYGQSESVLGQIGLDDRWQITTKLPSLSSDCVDPKKWVNDHILGSLTRLKIEQLHSVLFHKPLELQHSIGQDLVGELRLMQADGLINNVGISAYERNEIDIALNLNALDVVQIPLNIFDRRFVGSEEMNRFQKLGVEIQARSVFLQGLLLMPSKKRHSYFDKWHDHFNELERWEQSKDIGRIEACLGVVKSIPQIDKVIIGIDCVDQLLEISNVFDQALKAPPAALAVDDVNLINPSMWILK